MIDITSLSWKLPKCVQEKNLSSIMELSDDDIKTLILPYRRQDCWENCAILLAKLEDYRLSLFLPQILEWYKDLNWPGLDIIEKRVKALPEYIIRNALNITLNRASKEDDEEWYENLCVSFSYLL